MSPMRHFVTALFAALVSATSAHAQQLSLWGAYSRSQFDWPGHSQASSVPLGARLATTGAVLQVGVEASTNEVLPFEYRPEGSSAGIEEYRKQFIQRIVAATLVLDPRPQEDFSVYARAGFGGYQAFTRVSYTDERPDEDEEPVIRTAPSIGVGVRIAPLMFEGVYHVLEWVVRPDGEPVRTNSVEIRLGFVLR